MTTERSFDNEPCFVISIAAHMVGVHAQTLRYYERVGLVMPSRSEGKRRLYSPNDIDRLRRIKALTGDMGVNLAGVEVVLKLMERIIQLEKENDRLSNKVKRLQATSSSTRGPG